MRYKRKLILVLIAVTTLTVIQFVLPADSRVVVWYHRYVFHPFQMVRNMLFSYVPFSVGDVLYAAAGLVLLTVFVRWVFFIIKFKSHRHDLAISLLQSVVTLSIIYIIFILGWGGNYFKMPLSQFWKVPEREISKQEIIRFDHFLVRQLNVYAPGYYQARFSEINKKAKSLFKDYTVSKSGAPEVRVKASLYGFWMQHLGIQGYYNPFTGEAQVNRFLPIFMLPFVICHEMSHQAGVAAEDDANLLAYAISTIAPDSLFRYSAYLNLWLYTHMRVKAIDSIAAREIRKELNQLTHAHLDTLRSIRSRYESEFSAYTGAIYDGYLRLHQQHGGLSSYNRVTLSALLWEMHRRPKMIPIP